MEKDRNQDTLFPAVTFDEFPTVSYEEWKEEATASLKGAPFEKKLLTKTYEGIVLNPIYTEQDCENVVSQASFPGFYNYLRGTEADGYIKEPWVIAQSVDQALPEEANEVIKQELSGGANAVAFSLDSKLSLETLEDLDALLNGVGLDDHPLNIFAGESALEILALLRARADAHGYDVAKYHGAIGADPIAMYARYGKLNCSLDSSFDQLATAIKWGRQNMPDVKMIFIQGHVYHNGGANAVQEVSCCMAEAIAYIDALAQRGLSIDEIAGNIRFGFSLGANFFMEIAKLRAARMVWAQIVKSYGGSEDVRKSDICARSSAFTATVFDPYVNILRGTTQAFSGVVGGVNEMQVAPFDEAVRPSDEQSRRIARNIQVMMQNEFNLLSPVDPAGGSWYVETLTAQVAEAIWQAIQQIEAADGVVSALTTGKIQDEIAATLAERFKNLAVRKDRAVGSNMYANMSEQPLDVNCQSERIAAARTKARQAHEASADKAAKATAIAAIDGSVYSLVKAVAAGADLQELAQAVNEGTSDEIKAIVPHRWTEQFEDLRHSTDKIVAETGSEIKAFLCTMGPIPQHKPRADFSTGFMEVAGFKVINNGPHDTIEAAAADAIASNADVAVICSTDDTYPEIVPGLAKAIKAERPAMKVILAGAPAPEYKDAYLEAGVDDFIHVKANCLKILSEIQNARRGC